MVGYEYFTMSFERVAWKASNCVVVTCEHAMERMKLNDNMLRQSLEARERIKAMCGNLSRVTGP